jgi:metal-sulfur cluster biosynthetic enzyme
VLERRVNADAHPAPALDAQIRDVLSHIHDPCSIAAGRPISLIDMGLVRGWTLERGTLTITFCVTFAGCTMAPHFTEAAARDLAVIEGIGRVCVRIDTDFVWTPDLMTAPPIAMTGKAQAWRDRINP